MRHYCTVLPGNVFHLYLKPSFSFFAKQCLWGLALVFSFHLGCKPLLFNRVFIMDLAVTDELKYAF